MFLLYMLPKNGCIIMIIYILEQSHLLENLSCTKLNNSVLDQSMYPIDIKLI